MKNISKLKNLNSVLTFTDNFTHHKTRFEIVPCKSTDDNDDDDDEEINDVRISATLMSATVDDPKPNFSLCCGEAVSTLPLLPKKTTAMLQPDR